MTMIADEGAQELRPRSELTARELLREVGSVLRLSEADAAKLGDLPEDPDVVECHVVSPFPSLR